MATHSSILCMAGLRENTPEESRAAHGALGSGTLISQGSGEGSCGGGGAPRDSAGSGATEEGLTSSPALSLGGQATAGNAALGALFA